MLDLKEVEREKAKNRELAKDILGKMRALENKEEMLAYLNKTKSKKFVANLNDPLLCALHGYTPELWKNRKKQIKANLILNYFTVEDMVILFLKK